MFSCSHGRVSFDLSWPGEYVKRRIVQVTAIFTVENRLLGVTSDGNMGGLQRA